MELGTLGFLFRYQKSTLQCPRKSVSRRVWTLLVSFSRSIGSKAISVIGRKNQIQQFLLGQSELYYHDSNDTPLFFLITILSEEDLVVSIKLIDRPLHLVSLNAILCVTVVIVNNQLTIYAKRAHSIVGIAAVVTYGSYLSVLMTFQESQSNCYSSKNDLMLIYHNYQYCYMFVYQALLSDQFVVLDSSQLIRDVVVDNMFYCVCL